MVNVSKLHYIKLHLNDITIQLHFKINFPNYEFLLYREVLQFKRKYKESLIISCSTLELLHSCTLLHRKYEAPVVEKLIKYPDVLFLTIQE